MIFAFIAENRSQFKVSRLCEFFNVSRSGFYAWLARPESTHSLLDKKLKSVITEFHQGYRKAYGAARVHQGLLQAGYPCSRRRVNRLMRELGIKASTTGLYAWRPGQHEFYASTANHLKNAPDTMESGQYWGGDFTYIKTAKGWLYHAVILDLYSRKVVGWSFATSRNSELTKSAFKMAISRENPKGGCVLHTDQGVEYAAYDYRNLVEKHGLKRSMSRKGTPLDNAIVESFFHTMKAELVHQQKFANPIEAVAHIVEYIEFYNRERLHSGLGYKSPNEYEKLCA